MLENIHRRVHTHVLASRAITILSSSRRKAIPFTAFGGQEVGRLRRRGDTHASTTTASMAIVAAADHADLVSKRGSRIDGKWLHMLPRRSRGPTPASQIIRCERHGGRQQDGRWTLGLQ
ncbi:hypothetical protein MRB53_042284 [Persea americana]|nr:hypothetical protein MRB53_042284 [Persea americana]